ncbi:hypothetical protein [Aneurinibacillus danicus]|uniref:Uncharacterized protein n=1 Tax=Aneurinibacillus danicus TaxID=267746 RepID=A0A511VAH4_9BACL|nr:hypothetical protein [Aneurinibacillus danicus]GEN35936.1 hypothetical protein ADA01nite_33960 [Aneurinibacillus danicus]
MIRKEGRVERSDKKIRVNAGLSKESHALLEQLAYAVQTPKTILAAEIIELCLNNPDFITYIQKIHNVPDGRRVIPVSENGKITYMWTQP